MFINSLKEQGINYYRNELKNFCQVNNLEAMKRLYGEARELGLVTEMVKDAGRTEIPAGTITLLGIGPGPRRVIDELTGTLPLVK